MHGVHLRIGQHSQHVEKPGTTETLSYQESSPSWNHWHEDLTLAYCNVRQACHHNICFGCVVVGTVHAGAVGIHVDAGLADALAVAGGAASVLGR